MVIVTFSQFTLSVVLLGKGQNCPLLPLSLIFLQEDVDDVCVHLKWDPHLCVYVGESLRRLAGDTMWMSVGSFTVPLQKQ